MQLDLLLGEFRLKKPVDHWLSLGFLDAVPLILVPNRRARRYVLRLRGDGSARVTIPRGGSAIEARRFAERNIPWLERQWLKNARKHQVPADWRLGCEILFRGERVVLKTAAEPGIVEFGTESLRVKDPAGDLRLEIEGVLAASRRSGVVSPGSRTGHSSQCSRPTYQCPKPAFPWGSCSCRGTVSLTWRLVQVPGLVCDYIILHELAHFKEMDQFQQVLARSPASLSSVRGGPGLVEGARRPPARACPQTLEGISI